MCPSLWHLVPAGTVDRPDLPGLILDELEEETGVPREVVTGLCVQGICDTGAEQRHKPELVFRLCLGISAREMEACFEENGDKDENERIEFIDLSYRGIDEYVDKRDGQMVGVAKVALKALADSLRT